MVFRWYSGGRAKETEREKQQKKMRKKCVDTIRSVNKVNRMRKVRALHQNEIIVFSYCSFSVDKLGQDQPKYVNRLENHQLKFTCINFDAIPLRQREKI